MRKLMGHVADFCFVVAIVLFIATLFLITAGFIAFLSSNNLWWLAPGFISGLSLIPFMIISVVLTELLHGGSRPMPPPRRSHDCCYF